MEHPSCTIPGPPGSKPSPLCTVPTRFLPCPTLQPLSPPCPQCRGCSTRARWLPRSRPGSTQRHCHPHGTSVTGQPLPEAGSAVSQSSKAGLAPSLRTGLTAQGFSMHLARLCRRWQPLAEVGEGAGAIRVKLRCWVWQIKDEEGWAGIRVQRGVLPALILPRPQDPEGCQDRLRHSQEKQGAQPPAGSTAGQHCSGCPTLSILGKLETAQLTQTSTEKCLKSLPWLWAECLFLRLPHVITLVLK